MGLAGFDSMRQCNDARRDMTLSPKKRNRPITGNNINKGFPMAVAMDATPSLAIAPVRMAA